MATCFIPPDIVLRSVRQDRHSDFVTFLLSILDSVVVEDLVRDYQLGVTSKKDVIFFQLDIGGSCRTGKIMKYDPETGHRIKDENTSGRINWVHSVLKARGMLPEDWTLTQCLFGEHLLQQYPKKVVALVESEKTAVICAGLMPRFLKAAEFVSADKLEELEALIRDLGLQFIRAEKMPEDCHPEPAEGSPP